MRKGQLRYMLAGNFYRLAWVEHGDPAAPVVLCVHGLTRNGRDFDPLAEALSDRFRVICPDLPGRGRSDWLPDATLYNPCRICWHGWTRRFRGWGPRWVARSACWRPLPPIPRSTASC